MNRPFILLNRDDCVLKISRKKIKNQSCCLLLGFWGLLICASALANQDEAAPGKALTMERNKGNCLACHAVDDGVLPGNLGPPLFAMKARFPDAEVLYKQIWDASTNNPNSRMPPFGRHGILNKEEIELIIDYLYTL